MTVHELPPESRVWVFASTRTLAAEDEGRLATLAERVLGLWKTKTPQVRGEFELRESRFLLLGADERAECLSGCSIDAMMSWIAKLERESGLRLVDRMTVYWRAPDGAIRSAPRAEFRALVESGEVGPRTPVFDTAMSRVETLQGGRFELPLEESWHAQLFLPRAATAAPDG